MNIGFKKKTSLTNSLLLEHPDASTQTKIYFLWTTTLEFIICPAESTSLLLTAKPTEQLLFTPGKKSVVCILPLGGKCFTNVPHSVSLCVKKSHINVRGWHRRHRTYSLYSTEHKQNALHSTYINPHCPSSDRGKSKSNCTFIPIYRFCQT